MSRQVTPGHCQPARLAEHELGVDEGPLLEAAPGRPVPVDGPAVAGAVRGVAFTKVRLYVKGVPAVAVAADLLDLEVSDERFAGFTGGWHPPVVVFATRIIAGANSCELRIWPPV